MEPHRTSSPPWNFRELFATPNLPRPSMNFDDFPQPAIASSSIPEPPGPPTNLKEPYGTSSNFSATMEHSRTFCHIEPSITFHNLPRPSTSSFKVPCPSQAPPDHSRSFKNTPQFTPAIAWNFLEHSMPRHPWNTAEPLGTFWKTLRHATNTPPRL